MSLVDYTVNVKGKKKVFHVNMLRTYYERPAQLERIISNVEDETTNIEMTSVISLPEDTKQDVGLQNSIILPALKQNEFISNIKVSTSLSSEQNAKVSRLLNDFKDVFSDVPGRTNAIEHKIVLNSDIPVRCRPYPVPLHYREQVKKEIQEMLRQGIIEEFTSDYCASIIVIKKKDNSLRLCVDYRRLNVINRIDPVPMQNAEDLLAQVPEAKFFFF